MNPSQRRELFRDEYFRQLETREKVEARLIGLAPVLAVVGSLIGYLGRTAFLATPSPDSAAFVFAFFFGAFAFIGSVVFFCAAIYGYRYRLLPTPTALRDYYETILDAYQAESSWEGRAWANEAFEEYIADEYVRLGTHNTRNNDTKMLNISRSVAMLILAFSATMIAYITDFVFALGT